jgi:hypothetical protein
LQTKPILDKLPNPHDEAAVNKNMIMIFLDFLVKLTKPIIIPTPSTLSIRRPKPILQSQPSVILCLWRCPSLSNDFDKARFHKAEKLQLICGSRRILPIGGELSSDIILHVHPKMHV